MVYKKLANIILTGGEIPNNLNQSQKILLDEIDNLGLKDEYNKLSKLSQEELINIVKEKDKIINVLEMEKQKKPTKTTNVSDYSLVNLFKFLKTEDGKIIKENDENYKLDEFETAFDKNLRTGVIKFRDYQKKFIEDWSISLQELVILYYGVGSGKTLIAVNCAEQFINLNIDSKVYFLLPASLVLGTIMELYTKGIDAARKNKNGEYIYNFISYQQMLRSNFDFSDNSLLIIDEVHNLRNIRSSEIKNKVSARKWESTDSYSLIGNKLAEVMIYNSSKFIRKLFMSGTIFVNGPEDLEPIISIGYNKAPMLDFNKKLYENIITNDDAFKTYYQGLISYYKIEGTTKKQMPRVNYEFVIINSKTVQSVDANEDAFYIESRNQAIAKKMAYILKYINTYPNDKVLVYAQFLDRVLIPLIDKLKEKGIKFGFISGKLNQSQKLEIVRQYNNDEINVLIFTLSIKEGISFKETDTIIVMQPYWNYAIMEQIIARGVRLNSHKRGNKSLLEVKFLVGVPKTDDHYNNTAIYIWKQNADDIMNRFIHTIEYDKNNELHTNSFGSRDINLYNRMFIKTSKINVFEKKLLKLPKFEDVNNAENNVFIKYFNNTVLDLEQEKKKKLTIKEMITLKRKMYDEFYKKNIELTNKNITRFSNDSKFKSNRNPNLEEQANLTKFKNKEDEIIKLVNEGASLEKIFSTFEITKQDITNFQANFTPPQHVKQLINFSGIENDITQNIKILEPTAGIGNIIGGLIKLKNSSNFSIDANELFNLYYQIGKAIYNNIDNVIWYNLDFYYNYNQKYNYNYIIGNPPFNLRTIRELKGRKLDTTLYDINFVEVAYNMLKDNGVLCFIISNRFERDKSHLFLNFNKILKFIKKYNEKYVEIETLKTDFKVEDETKTTKSQETNFGMVMIKLIKIPKFIMNILKPPLDEKEIEQIEKENEIKKLERAKKKKEKMEKEINKPKEQNKQKLKKEKLIEKEIDEEQPNIYLDKTEKIRPRRK
jgi:superfamily II DNA or RNA helicase